MTELAVQSLSTPNLSSTGCRWIVRKAQENDITALMQRYDLPELLARVLAARGIGMDDAERFLNPSLKTCLPDPSHLLDMDKAADRIVHTLVEGEQIAIFGDYDVDGATSSALLMRFFRSLGLNPVVYIPDRMKEGYGPNTKALLGLRERGAHVVITVDCGTLAFEPIAAAQAMGLDVIVVDHHIGVAQRPNAYALVNPNRLDETSPHRQLAAVGVAFLLCVAINRQLRQQGFFTNRSEPDLKQWLDIVALGTICDVVPLIGVNRALVSQGLKILAARGNAGIRAVLDLTNIAERPSVYHAGFVIGPRINAGGRVGKSDLGVRLLTADDEGEARALAKELDVHNAERKAIESMVMEEAMAAAQSIDVNMPILVVAGHGWHSGVIGIVAGRLKERFHKPSVVIALQDGIGKASARSVSGWDIGAAVIAARDAGLLLAGGGHAMAAGFTVEEVKIPALIEFFRQRMDRLGYQPGDKRFIVDSYISLGGVSMELAESMEQLGPFGQGNPALRFAIAQAVNLKPCVVGEQHIKTLLIDRLSNARLSAIAFRAVGSKLGDILLATSGQSISLVGQLRSQEWNGRKQVSFMIEDVGE